MHRHSKSWFGSAPAQLLAAAVALVVAGCGASPPEPAPPPPPPVDDNLLNLVPAGAQLVLWIDVKQLRSSPSWEVARLALGDREYEEIKRTTGVDPLEEVDEALIAVTQKANGEDVFVAAIKGRLTAPSALQKMAATGRGTLEQREELTVVAGDKLFIVAVTDRTVVVCTPNAVDSVVDLAHRRGKPLTSDTAFADLPLDEGAAALLRFRRGPGAIDLSRYNRRAPIRNVDKITDLDARLSVGTGLEVNLTFDVEDKLVAKSTAREIRRLTNRMSHNPFVMLIGMDWIFDRIEVASEGIRVTINAVLDARDVEQLRSLAERLRKIREIAEPGEGKIEFQFKFGTQPEGQE